MGQAALDFSVRGFDSDLLSEWVEEDGDCEFQADSLSCLILFRSVYGTWIWMMDAMR